jgi:hypothetical protein
MARILVVTHGGYKHLRPLVTEAFREQKEGLGMDVAPNTGIGPRRTPAAPDDPNAKSGYAQTFLALTALGVVFGDIGTSPLYAFSVALKATGKAPTTEHVLGVVSLTFWALMLIISLKYVAIVMRADNDGEGGILALLSLVEHQDPPAQRARLSIVVLLGIIGAALLYGDGVITPAISVLSAMEGIKFSPAAADFVVPVTLVIFRSSIPRNRQRRPVVWTGDGGLVRRHRRARHRQYLGGAGDPPRVQSP